MDVGVQPPIWPYRAVFFAAFALLALQAIAQLIRCYLVLAGRQSPGEKE